MFPYTVDIFKSLLLSHFAVCNLIILQFYSCCSRDPSCESTFHIIYLGASLNLGQKNGALESVLVKEAEWSFLGHSLCRA